MKKIALLLVAFLFVFVFRPAQAQVAKRDRYLNAGLGLGVYNAGGIPIGASLEVGLKDKISVGGFADYVRYGYRSLGYKWNYNFIYFGGRASYHLGNLLKEIGMSEEDKFDPYAGVSIGIRTVSYNDHTGVEDYVNPYSTGIIMGLHLGTRYMLSDKIGGFGEVGYGVSALRLGLTVKL